MFGEDIKLRFRPSYFPFTEPSAEVDILSNEGKWLEILGCGLVNPVVFRIVILIQILLWFSIWFGYRKNSHA